MKKAENNLPWYIIDPYKDAVGPNAEVIQLAGEERTYPYVSFERLKENPAINEICFPLVQVRQIKAMEEVQLLPNLYSLKLNHNGLTEFDFSVLRKNSDLSVINLAYNLLSEANLDGVECLQNLSRFAIGYNLIKEISLEPLGKCARLENLNLSTNPIKELNLSPVIENCRQLETISLGPHPPSVLDCPYGKWWRNRESRDGGIKRVILPDAPPANKKLEIIYTDDKEKMERDKRWPAAPEIEYNPKYYTKTQNWELIRIRIR